MPSLSALLTIPQRIPNSVAGIPLPVVIQGVLKYDKSSPGQRSPDADCGKFYTLNHLLSRIQGHFHKDEPLPDWASTLVSNYSKEVVGQSRRMMTYLLLIITRESRHLKNVDDPKLKAAHKSAFVNHSKLYAFQHSICGAGESYAVSTLKESPPDVSFGEYVRHISFMFNRGKWNGGYGGKAWGGISDCLLGFVEGEYSLEVLVDLAYALAHNNGPIFNKGMLYENYSTYFIRILDLQRAGMLPALLLASELNHPLQSVHDRADPDKSLRVLCTQVQKTLGGLPTEIDFKKVYQFSPKPDQWSAYLTAKEKLAIEAEKNKVDESDDHSSVTGLMTETVEDEPDMPSAAAKIFSHLKLDTPIAAAFKDDTQVQAGIQEAMGALEPKLKAMVAAALPAQPPGTKLKIHPAYAVTLAKSPRS